MTFLGFGRAWPAERQSFPVTDDLIDAPDGAVIEQEDGWWQRSGMTWFPIPPPEPKGADQEARSRSRYGGEVTDD